MWVQSVILWQPALKYTRDNVGPECNSLTARPEIYKRQCGSRVWFSDNQPWNIQETMWVQSVILRQPTLKYTRDNVGPEFDSLTTSPEIYKRQCGSRVSISDNQPWNIQETMWVQSVILWQPALKYTRDNVGPEFDSLTTSPEIYKRQCGSRVWFSDKQPWKIQETM